MSEPLAESEPRTTIRLLDGFVLEHGPTPLHVIPGARRLLALLAVRQAPVSRAVVAAMLWPEATARRAAACLRSTLWRLAQPGAPLVEPTEDALRLGAAVDVDFHRACRLAATAAEAGTPDPEAVALLKADLLPGWSDQWLAAEQDWWHEARLRALEALSTRFRSAGDRHRAHQAALAAVQSDPLRESAHRTLVELHLDDGNPAQAVRQYRSYRSRLRAELGLEPSPEIHRLVGPLLGGRA
ncbi:BTAD domain-containing putative transcriptional regulator [Saccharothrix longispora]|uniref:AfsR/SARP family transcriptional regulator n=1 Tax=Saccharothrix longispora TaxID=33920 RepID=UPI0028FD9383|nr:BTAD domain-containing putative transcriptional regulator [Saccharothrix longispora]MBY8850397.1 transcriptional regulator [Saccharothrix sp. MB29]MDU0289106.1 BTAD domain-containing putative transcriptional regulator [Saccharothrix longispora]